MKRKKELRYLTMQERWEADIQSYEKCGGMTVKSPLCQRCKYRTITDIYHCDKYDKEQKPMEVMRALRECPYFESSEPIEIRVRDDRERRLKGGIFGAIVGDALGVPVEFSSRRERKKDPVNEMRGYGTHNQEIATWSDDTSMLLCLLEALTEGYSADKLAEKFVRFANEGYMTPHGTVFDIGNAVMKAINKKMSGVPSAECGGSEEYDNGNGSLMRILPLAFYLENADDARKIGMIEEVSSITHRHPISLLSCVIYIQLASELMLGKGKDDAYSAAMDHIRANVIGRYSAVSDRFEKILSGKLISRKEWLIKSTGYVLDSLEAAIWCFMNSDSYEECVFKAVNLGDDTDTVACIAGGLAGIFYGVDRINNNWIQMLFRKNDINEMIDRFIDSL